MKRLLALVFLATSAVAQFATSAVAAPVHVVTDNNASCDVGTYVAATLLLPYFEVDYTAQSSKAVNTVFTVINTSKLPQIVRVTVWSDLGYPAVWFNMFLSGFDVQSVSMYELIARGNVPVTYSGLPPGAASADNEANPNIIADDSCARSGGTIPLAIQDRLRSILTTGIRDTGCRVGLQHKNATGYVTIDLVNSCAKTSPMDPAYWTSMILYDNVLSGDYERMNPNPSTGNYAGGSPLVHIRAIPEGGAAGSQAKVPMPYTFYDRYTPEGAKKADRRQPLPAVWAARYIEGGPTGFQTNFMVWREGFTGATSDECEYAKNEKLPLRAIVRFDEHENATTGATSLTLPPTSATASTAPILPPMAGSDRGGWFWLSLDNGARPRPSQNWITVQMYAEGRYGVDFDASWLANGCTSTVPSAP